IRKGREKEIQVVIGEMPEEEKEEAVGKVSEEELGIKVGNLTPELAEKLGYEDESGVVILEVYPGSVAEMAGLTKGDLIKEINGEEVKNLKDYQRAIKKAIKRKKPIRFLIRRGEYTFFVVVKLE
ncbi:MAG TPA: PDZ domain-containing protein, partial [bacterium]|nr:PDZ domain-containing protein [bacterium]HEX67676.1 PDZ domain-containing protein [bacterium]